MRDDGITAGPVTSSVGAKFMRRFTEAGEKRKAKECAWIDDLRSRGVKAAHPDDGWVNRRDHEVHLAYPIFNDGLAEGDLLALGDPQKFRVVRVTRFRLSTLHLGWFLFEGTGDA